MLGETPPGMIFSPKGIFNPEPEVRVGSGLDPDGDYGVDFGLALGLPDALAFGFASGITGGRLRGMTGNDEAVL